MYGETPIYGEKSPHVWEEVSPNMRRLPIYGETPHKWGDFPPMGSLTIHGEKSPLTWGEVSPYRWRLPMAFKYLNAKHQKVQTSQNWSVLTRLCNSLSVEAPGSLQELPRGRNFTSQIGELDDHVVYWASHYIHDFKQTLCTSSYAPSVCMMYLLLKALMHYGCKTCPSLCSKYFGCANFA
jgi:hypothetical protein